MSQRHCGRNLIHVLSTRSGRSRESFFQIAFAKADLSYSSFDRSFHRQSEAPLKPARYSRGRDGARATSKSVHRETCPRTERNFRRANSALIKKCSDLAKINV